jgi:hypothetical protein
MSLWRNRTGGLKSIESCESKGQKRARALAWACESLEQRVLMATDSWITQGNGNWSVGSNWSLGRAPITSDNVVIDVPGLNIVVTYNGGGQITVNNLLNNELLNIGGGGVAWTGGVWDGAGTVAIQSSLAMSGTDDKILRDGMTLFNTGNVTLTGTGNIVGQVGATITNLGGTFDVESDADITFPTGVGDGVFNNGGLFEKTGGGTAAGDMTEVGGAQGFTFNDSDNYVFPVAQGDCKVLVGTLDLGDDQNVSLTQGGTFEISANATLEYDRGAENIITYTNPITNVFFPSSITGDGRLLMSGGTLHHWGNFAIHQLDVESGELHLNENFNDLSETVQRFTGAPVIQAGTTDIFNFDGGTFGGAGGGTFPTPSGPQEYQGLIVGTSFSWTGGTFDGIGRTLLDTSCTTATITTTNPKAITGTYGVDFFDEVIWQDSGTIDITGNSVLWIHPTGTLWDQGDGTITAAGDTGNVWNAGNFLKEDGTGTTTIDTGISFINESAWPGRSDVEPLYAGITPPSPLVAQLDIRTGVVLFNGDLTNSDTVLIHPTALLNLAAGTDINGTNDSLNAPAKILGVDGGGAVVFGAIQFTGDTRARLDVPNVNFGSGVYDFNNLAGGAQLVTAAVFNGGIIGGNGTLEIGIDPNNPPVPLIPATFLWTAGTLVGTGGTTSSLLIDPSAILTIPSGDRTTTNGYSIDNRGTIEWTVSPGLLSIDGNFDQTSTGVFDSVIEAGTPSLDSLSVTGTITLDGTLNLTDATPPLDTEVFTLISNLGTVPATGIFIGLPEGTMITIDAAVYTISYIGNADGLDVTLTAAVLPTITIETPTAIIEPTSGTEDLLFVVDLSQAVAHTVTIDYASSDLTATAGVDYTATSGTLTFDPGIDTNSIMVPIIGSTDVKPTETFTMTLSNPVGGLLGTPSSAIGTILNENGPPIFTFSSPTYSIDDDLGEATITVIRTNSPTIPVTVDYSTSPGTATPNVNYIPVTGTLDFGINVNTLEFQVPVINDQVFGGSATTNGDVTFNVALSNPEGDNSVVGTPGTAVVTVVETTLPSISVSNATAVIPTTGTATLAFIVSVQANPNTVEVNYTTTDGTAIAGTDYTATASTLTFAAGQTALEIDVTVLPDTAVTADKTMTLDLSNSVNGNIVTVSGVGTLINDNIPAVSIADTNVTEPLGGRTNAVFTVSLDSAPFHPVTVAYSTADGTAIAGTDYVAEAGTVTFAVGQSAAQIDVPVNTTFSTASGSDFTVSLTSPTEATLGNATATGQINNLSVNTVTFDAGHPFRYVGAPANHITVGLSGPGTGTLTYLGLLIDDVKEIQLDGTTAASVFSIRTSQPRAFLQNLTVDGSIRSIIAPTTSLQGNLNVEGAVSRIQMQSVLGGNTLSIGAPATGLGTLNAIFSGTVTDATLTSGMPFAALRVGNAADFTLTAPSAVNIIATGSFSGDVSLAGSLGALHVARTLSGSSIDVGGNIGIVSAQVVANSSIFAGVDSNVTTLPTSATAFENGSSTIGQIAVRRAFSSTLIAAPIIGNVSLGTVTTLNGGVAFGVAGTSIRSVRGRGDVLINQTQAKLVTSPFGDADLVIRLTN